MGPPNQAPSNDPSFPWDMSDGDMKHALRMTYFLTKGVINTMLFSKTKTVTALAGVVLLLGTFLLGGLFAQSTQAQPSTVTQSGSVGRYQISSFAYRWDDGSTCGAYILDTQTGDVFQVVGKSEPEVIGSVTRPQPKK